MFLRFTKTRDYADYAGRPKKKQTNTFRDFVCVVQMCVYYYNVVVIRRRWDGVYEKYVVCRNP